MNLDDLTFEPSTPKPPPLPAANVKTAEVIEDDMCAACKVPSSAESTDGTCNVCGAAWEDDDDGDEFMTALELLYSCELLFNQLLGSRGLVNKMSVKLEQDLREVAISVSDFNESYDIPTPG